MSQPHPESKSQLFSLSRLPELSSTRQVSAEHFLTLGNRHYNDYLTRTMKRDLDMAITSYRQALDMNPGLPEAHVKLASALWDRGVISLELALEYCDTGLLLNPEFSDAHLFKGYFLRRSGRLDEAIHHFRQAIVKCGEGQSPAKARMALGQTMLQKARFAYELPKGHRFKVAAQGMQSFLFGCIQLPGDQNTLRLMQGALCTDLQIFSLLGVGRFFKSMGLKSMSVRLYQWSAKLMPAEPIFHHLLGDLHVERDNLDGALYSYTRAQELDPDNTLIHKKLGHAYHECKDAANAARSLEKVVEAEAADYETLYTLAQVYSDQAEYMRALYYYKELLNQDVENAYIHSNMAYVLFKLGDYDGAIQEYHTAVKLGKDPVWTATVAQTLGTIYYQVKQDLDAAASVFQMASQLDPGDLDCLSMLGDVYTEQGNFEAAIKTYRYILDVEPDNAECHNYLGYLLWQMDKNDEAIDAYNRALALNPENPIAYNNLGVIYLDEKCQLQTALQMFGKAFEQKPDYTLACFNVARTREALGQTAEAAKGYTQALMLNAENQELSDLEIQERLDNLFQV
jgi:tetratricopeptide (TPR) repeat protein